MMGKLLLVVQVFLLSSSVRAQNNGTFPDDFLFGVGTSAYQTEGAWNADGKGENIWDHWIHDDVTHIADNETADLACDSYRLYRYDIDALRELNASHYQFSISWSSNCKKGCSAKCGCKKVGLFCSLARTNCQGRSCSNVESTTVEDSFDSNEETCDVSLLRQFTCTQDEEEEQKEEQEEEEAEVLENYESDEILPNGNDINMNGILYYKSLIAEIINAGVIPVATLYHNDLPQSLQDIGGWMNSEMVNYFVKYARIAFQYFDNVGYWLTFNDPRSTCVLGYGAGTYAPGIALDGIGEYQCAYVLVKSHAAAYHLYKDEFSSRTAKMSIAVNLEWYQPASNSAEDTDAAERRELFEFGLYANPIYKGNWPQVVIDRVGGRSKNENLPRSRLPEFTQEEIDYINGTFDFMAVNMFTTYLVQDVQEAYYGDPSYVSDMKAWVFIDPDWEISSDEKPIVPWGARRGLVWLKNTYNNPEIFITGNGVSNFENNTAYLDYGRAHFYHQYLDAILYAMYEDDVRVFGYTAWSLLDCFEWTKGYSKPYGFFQVNLTEVFTRHMKYSVNIYRGFASTHRIHDPEYPTTTTSAITSTTSVSTPATTTPDSASKIMMNPLLILVIAYLSYSLC